MAALAVSTAMVPSAVAQPTASLSAAGGIGIEPVLDALLAHLGPAQGEPVEEAERPWSPL